MAWFDGVVALLVIAGVIYIIVVKMKEKNKGQRVLDKTASFFEGGLIRKKEPKIKEAKEQVWLEKRNIV